MSTAIRPGSIASRIGGTADTFHGFRFEKVTENSLWHGEANNVGYRDQRYFAEYEAIGKIKVNGEWNEIPLFISDDTATLYTVSKSGTFTIDDNIQNGIESGATTLANVIGQAAPFEARTQRNTALFNLNYAATRDLDVKFAVRNSLRDGYNLQSLNFGFSNTIESEVPLNDRTTDVKAAIEFANAKGLLSLGYNGSWYNNQINAYRFDNPTPLHRHRGHTVGRPDVYLAEQLRCRPSISTGDMGCPAARRRRRPSRLATAARIRRCCQRR